MITVALIDDHTIVRSGFAQLLGLEPDLQVVAAFVPGHAFDKAANRHRRFLHAQLQRGDKRRHHRLQRSAR